MDWYAVERSYRVRDVVFVDAANADAAKQKVRDTEYDYVTDPEAVGDPFSLKAQRRPGVPRWIWEEMGYPDNMEIEPSDEPD